MKINTEGQNKGKLINKKILIFDLDGTLTKSKADLDKEMSFLLCQLLEKKIVAVIGGGDYSQFKKQFLDKLKCPKSLLKNLIISSTSGAEMYGYKNNRWNLLYKNILTDSEKKQIFRSFEKSFQDINYIAPQKTYGKIIEDRGSQITFSALGQKAPLAEKEKWNKKQDARRRLKTALEKNLKKYLPKFNISLGGLTSIDITKKGIDKAFGIRQIAKLLSCPIKDMVYIGDALYKGGNDSAAKKTGIDFVQISDYKETKGLIKRLIYFLNCGL